MKITKDLNLNVGYVQFRSGKVVETVEIRPGILIDLGKSGEVLGIEVLSLQSLAPALRNVSAPKKKRVIAKRKVA